MANILIVGCGDLGTRTALLLHNAGHRVFGMRRNTEQLPPAIQPIAADLTATWPALPEALDLVFYTAAASARSESAYRAAYQTGVQKLVNALVDQGQDPARVFFTSSTSIYHQQQGEWVDEATPVAPSGFTGEAMRAGEQILADSPFPSTSVRLSGLYGPGRYWLLRQALSGQRCPEDPPCYSNRIHRDDAAAALAFLGERALKHQPLATTYIASDPNPAPLHEVLAWIRQQLGLPPLPANAPQMPPRGSKRCSSKRLQDCGFAFRYPDYQTGYAEIITQYRQEQGQNE